MRAPEEDFATSATVLTGSSVRRLKSIDLLRGVAALGVLLHHAAIYGVAPDSAWASAVISALNFGHLGVPLFFVISGFCIHLKWAKQKAETGRESVPWGSFWRRRIMRLYPPYFVVLCLSMAIVVVAYLRHANVPTVTNYPEPRLRWIGLDFLAHLTMTHGLIPSLDRMGGNPPMWTLAREEYFYLLYALLLPWRRLTGTWGMLVGTVVLGLVTVPLFRFALGDRWPHWELTVTTSALTLWCQWCLGAVAAEAYCGLFRLPRVFSNPMTAIVLGVGAHFAGESIIAPLLWGGCFFCVVNWCVRLEVSGCWPRWRFTNWLSRVGVFSYSLYLIHHPVRGVVKQLLGSFALTQSPVQFFLCATIIAVAGYYAGKVFFWAVERHFLFERRPPATSTPRTPA